jgi:hypothetical protein
MDKKHYTAVVSFSVAPDKLDSLIEHISDCVKENTDHATDIAIISQEDENIL